MVKINFLRLHGRRDSSAGARDGGGTRLLFRVRIDGCGRSCEGAVQSTR